MDASTISLPAAGRRRGRYSDAFKAEIVAACKAPGISTVAVALANSLNANLVRRWVLESDPAHKAVLGLHPRKPRVLHCPCHRSLHRLGILFPA